jgi:hypothetical protein
MGTLSSPSPSDQSFFYKQNLESFYRLGCTGNLYDIVLEIKYTKMRNDFYRYLAWRIQTADIERKINSKHKHKHKSFSYPLFTNKSWEDIEKFVKAAVQIYNKSHPRQQTTVSHALKTLKEWWNHDFKEYQSERAIG